VPAAAQSPPADAELARMLRSGGVVIVVRHGATNEDEADTYCLAAEAIRGHSSIWIRATTL
jgi:hypothetical protein